MLMPQTATFLRDYLQQKIAAGLNMGGLFAIGVTQGCSGGIGAVRGVANVLFLRSPLASTSTTTITDREADSAEA